MPGRSLAVLILAAACWGAGTAVSKQAVAEIPPITLLGIQLAASLVFLGLVLVARGARRAPRSAGVVGWLGLLNPGVAYALSLVGLAQISASLSVLLWALEPILILGLAVAILGEHAGPRLVALSIAAIAGLGLVAYDPATSGAALGIALTIAGVGCCAVYTIASRRLLPAAESMLAVVAWQEGYALVVAGVLLAATAVTGGPVLPTGLTGVGVVSALASGIAYYGLAYWLYLSGLRHVPASVAAAAFYLVPVFGLSAAALFGERLSGVQLAGAAVVIAAVALITVRSPAPAAA